MIRRAALVAVLLFGCQQRGHHATAPDVLDRVEDGLRAIDLAVPQDRAHTFAQTIWESVLLSTDCASAVEHTANAAPPERGRAVSEASRTCHFSLPADPQARPEDVVTAFLVETSTRALTADPSPRAHELAARIGALAPSLITR